METSDLPSDANNANATIAMNLPTESKSVKRRSSERSLSARMRHGMGIDTCMPFRYRPCRVRWPEHKTMSRQTRFPYCMTLRLAAPMESELENLAYDRRMSKAEFIRRCIGQAIADAYQHGTPNKCSQAQRGAL
jgi:hypothetical protein